MPAKKSGGQSGPLMTLVKFPLTVGWRIVFEPAHLIMWIIVDKIGDKQIWGSKKLMNSKKVKKVVSYVKEFRAVLVDYYDWPKIPGPMWKCKFCGVRAEWWCCDCAKKCCAQCAYIQHAPNTNGMMHSVEEIIKEKEKKGVHFLSPILPEVMFLCLAYYLIFRKTFFHEDYLTTQVVCPAVNELKSFTATMDANLFYYYKNMFYTWCDYEDSFMRFILDMWARTVVMETDNTILVFQTLPKALLYDLVLTATLCPILSMLYALLLSSIYHAESYIPRVGRLGELEKWAELFAVSGSWFGAGEYGSFPPETKWRTRPMWDIIEGFKYVKQRWLKRFRYYYDSSLFAMKNLAWQLVMGTMVVRLACIWLPLAPLFRFVASLLGLRSLIQYHQQIFAGTTNHIVNEPLLRSLAAKGWSLVAMVMSFLPQPMRHFGIVWAFLLCLVVAANAYFVHKILSMRREFFLRWFAGEMEKSLDFKQKLTLQARPKTD